MPTRSGDAEGPPTPTWVTPDVTLGTAVLLYALVVGMQLSTSPSLHFPSVLVAIPALVALAFSPPMITGSAVVVTATRWAFLPFDGRIAAASGTTTATLVIATAACFVVRQRRRESSRLRKVTSVAETAQRAVLRPPPTRLGPFRIAAGYRAAAQFARIGGDLYAFVNTDFGVRALIGDVRGKGLDAVATAAVVLGSFHEAAYDRPTLGSPTDRLDISLRRSLVDTEAFVTAVLVELHPDGLTYALSCGHPAPLILRSDIVSELPAAWGLPLGLRGLAPSAGPVAALATRLRPGDTLLMYRDGLAEARDAAGDFYPLTRRLAHYGRTQSGSTAPGPLLDWIQTDALDHSGDDTHDDAALLALTWTVE
ncbi:PP2C family protein-serine/threonine phosphatase [Streptomyces sp. NPDC056105]|uniref:PP2C family protein-serine/threonine phosphatase n=1 Tax=Streptomyces sp. NPDC056105 TaxID=3345714 RepID=UPI0035D59786